MRLGWPQKNIHIYIRKFIYLYVTCFHSLALLYILAYCLRIHVSVCFILTIHLERDRWLIGGSLKTNGLIGRQLCKSFKFQVQE